MKMPEPVGVVSETWAHWPEKGEVACVDWLNDKSPSVGTKLYDKQSLIDLLEEAAKALRDIDALHNEGLVDVTVDTIRKLKETL